MPCGVHVLHGSWLTSLEQLYERSVALSALAIFHIIRMPAGRIDSSVLLPGNKSVLLSQGSDVIIMGNSP